VPLDKGGKASRVRLNDAALCALAELKQMYGDTGFVCGGRRSPRGWFEEAVKKAGIQDFHWHDLRHTFASRLTMSGADPRTVAQLLRDKTLAMAMRYAHLAPDFQLDAVKRMEAKFGQPTDTTVARNAVGKRVLVQ
jgi:integrase